MQDRYLGRIVQGMDVCDSHGEKIGAVAHAYRYDPAVVSMAGGPGHLPYDELIEVKTGFLGLGKHLFIPVSAIGEITLGGVFLSKTAEEVRQTGDWHEKPAYLDELH